MVEAFSRPWFCAMFWIVILLGMVGMEWVRYSCQVDILSEEAEWEGNG